MSVADGYNPDPLKLKLVLANGRDEVKYVYEMDGLAAGAERQDFVLRDGIFAPSVNDEPGILEFSIYDENGSLVEANNKAESKIKQGWHVQLFGGKEASSIKRWGYGIVESATVDPRFGQYVNHRIVCSLWFKRTADRKTTYQFIQNKKTDGTTPDPNDTDAKVTEILKRFIARRGHYVISEYPVESELGIPNLEIYHTFEDDLLDERNGHDISMTTGTEQYRTGIVGVGLDLDGSTEGRIPADSRHATKNFAWSMHIELDQLRMQGILQKKDGTGGFEWQVYQDSSNKIAFESKDGTIVTTDSLSTGSKVQIGIDYDDDTGTMRIFQDGKKKDSSSASIDNSNNDIIIAPPVTNRMDGMLDELRYYRQTLEQNQYGALYAVPFATDQIPDIDLKMSIAKSKHNTFMHIISKLAGLAGAWYGIDYNRRLFFRRPRDYDSGILITDSTTSSKTKNHDQAKVALIVKGNNINIKDSITKSGYTTLIGLGAVETTLDINNDPSLDAQHDLSSKRLAIPITPTTSSIQMFAMKLKQVGTIKDPLSIAIIGTDSSSNPNESNLLRRITIPAEDLRKLPTSPGQSSWIQRTMEKVDVVANNKIFIMISNHGDGSNHAAAVYDSATGTAYRGDPWESFIGNFPARTYPSKRTRVTVFNNFAFKKFARKIKEKLFNFREIPDEQTAQDILVKLSPTMASSVRSFPPVKVHPTDDPIPLGSKAEISESFTGLAATVHIIGYRMEFSARNQSNMGVRELKLNLQEFID